MKTILITGSNGFTGKYIINLLQEKGYRTVGLVYENPSVDEAVCDLTDKQSVSNLITSVKPDAVIHLAALSFVGHPDQKAFYDVNLFGTLNLLEALYDANLNLDKVIIASSANIYGSPAIKSINEEQIPSPMNHYAMSKLAMEYMVKLWFDKLPILLTRPFNYTGVGQHENFLIPKIVSHFRKKEAVIELGNLDVSRDFSDVRDIAEGYIRLLESAAHSEIVNLCSGRIYSLQWIIEQMNQIAGYKIEVKVNPDFVRENEIKVLGGDQKKMCYLTGFSSKIPLEQTLKDMYRA